VPLDNAYALSASNDAFGKGVSQTTASSTTIYPNAFDSITTAAVDGAATTDYVYAGSVMLETVDQPSTGGVATGTPVTRYIHTDNLGSMRYFLSILS
jgi:hypothetical protein